MDMTIHYGKLWHFCGNPVCPDPVWKLSRGLQRDLQTRKGKGGRDRALEAVVLCISYIYIYIYASIYHIQYTYDDMTQSRTMCRLEAVNKTKGCEKHDNPV